MTWPTSDQTQAFLRHMYSGAAGALAMAATLGIFHGDSTAVMSAVKSIGDGVAGIIAGLAFFVPFVTGIFASHKASTVQQAARIVESPDLNVIPLTEKGVEIVKKANEVVK